MTGVISQPSYDDSTAFLSDPEPATFLLHQAATAPCPPRTPTPSLQQNRGWPQLMCLLSGFQSLFCPVLGFRRGGGEGPGVMGDLVSPALHVIGLAPLLPGFQTFQLEKWKGMGRTT